MKIFSVASFAPLVTLLVVPVLVLGGCKPKAAASTGKKGGLRQAAFPVEVLKVDERPHELLITAPGVVDAFEHIQVTARVSGVVDKVSFVEGQEVKLGQSLVSIDSRRYALGVSTARAALTKSQATSADSEQSLLRRENATKANPGLIPGEELATYKTHLDTANADVEQAREALKLAQLNLDDSNVRAAKAGVIQTRSVQTGQYVQAGTVIASLLQRDPMLLRFNVTTAEAPRLKVEMPVEFTLKESQQTYTAKITLVGGAADPDSRLVPVTAEVASDHQFWLRPGSFAMVSVKLTSARQFPMIPQEAARPSERGFLAYVVEGDVAHEHVLQLGMHTVDGLVEVKAGLKAGDLLVTRGVEALAEGTKVTLAKKSGAGAGTTPAAASSGASAASDMERSSAEGSAAPPGSAAPHEKRHRAPSGSDGASASAPAGATTVTKAP